MARRSFLYDENGVTEVIGYVLSFALSAIFLLMALNIFHEARGNTEQVVTGVELRTIADRVAARIVEFAGMSLEYPNATVNATIQIPQALGDRGYTVTAGLTQILIATNDGDLSAAATTYRIDAPGALVVSGTADSANERVVVQYAYNDNTNNREITITGG